MQDILNVTLPRNFSLSNSTEQNNCDLFYFIANGICGLIICVVGLVGNILSFWIIKEISKNSTTFFLLKCLTIADTTIVLWFVVLVVVPEIILYDGTLEYYYSEFQYVYYSLFPFSSFSLTVTTWLTCILTSYRYGAVITLVCVEVDICFPAALLMSLYEHRPRSPSAWTPCPPPPPRSQR